MADENISQQDIEKLLSQGPGGAAPGAKPSGAPGETISPSVQGAEAKKTDPPPEATPKSAAATSPSPEDSNSLSSQEDIDKILSQAGKSPAAGTSPASARETSVQGNAGEGSMAEKDIEYLLNQAEKALESIGSAANNDLPQGVAAFRLEELSGAPASTEIATLDLVRDVELNLKIELGRTHMYLEDVLKLRKGSVVPLEKLAGDPVDIYVNERLIARGEVLVLNDNFCVRVAELIAGANAGN
jgi:flagellar motor switch protein FliN/FliY